MQYFGENPLLSKSLALKGGTAINLTVFDLPRLSVDIDWDFAIPCNKKEMLDMRSEINREIINFMTSQKYALNRGTKNPHSLDSWVFYYQNVVNNKDNIKIEINYSLRNHVFPLMEGTTSVNFLPQVQVQILSPMELFGSKIKALIERCAARDLYDVHNMLTKKIFEDDELDLLRKTILFYLAVGSSKQLTENFSFENIQKLKFSQIRSSLMPVLRKSERFDFEKAKEEIINFLQELLILTSKEKVFIMEFNKGNYRPDLLFDDPLIIKRIKHHPMALWKTRKNEF
ncbi:nucleotidyl transferase AbiEii/AbiGii toxin family protein [Anaerorudis cellulosivorans]|uniref:nucleotidyl transferase AbiEii/AbiGii toxin family protein n=1 Tax=Anaerorudis cellulosivorans TaxID=3397862 RepID=UPI00222087E9|nr:nucleotidyl transferase AbiEii/AbiGii toxin family protein [Seramator thermalis]MCW1735252.1 nucleotidyl transferase AbiEii/AbiGii toxin family protein [Seramator thermalis]